MANYATNIFHASTKNKQDLDKIEAFLDENFNGYVGRNDDTINAEFDSRWEYPEKEIDGNPTIEIFNEDGESIMTNVPQIPQSN